MKRVVNLVKNSWRFCIDLANKTPHGYSMLWVGIQLFFDVILDFWRKPIRRGSRTKMQIFKAELKFWMLGEFASLKSKHDGGVAEANQQTSPDVIANAVKQSFQLHNNGLPRRYAPRNDGGVASNGLPRRYAPRNDDCNVCGRSMIEMLGVLAIIAVLSVGGIAGYSKAMEKWKADRLISEYSYLIHGLLVNVGEFQNMSKTTNYDTQVGLAQYVQATSLVPQTWKYVISSRMTDSEGNPILMFSRRKRLVIDIYIGTELSKDGYIQGKSRGFSVTLCREIIQNLTKPLSDSLQFFRFYQWSEMEGSIVYYGNATCSEGRKCLRDLSVSEINDICKSCSKDKEACGINMEF